MDADSIKEVNNPAGKKVIKKTIPALLPGE